MIPSDRIVEELEKIRDKAYRDQPMMMDPLCDLISLLQYAFCEHVWEVKVNPDSPDGSSERFEVCKKCGSEKI